MTKKGTKLVLKDLIAKKIEKESKQSKIEDVYIDSLGGLITVKVPEERIVLKAVDMMKDESIEGVMESFVYLIYNAVDLFQSPELQQEYEVVVPTDIVYKLLEMSERLTLGNKILEMSGFNDIDKTIKK